MTTSKKTARTVGVLFITATATALLAGVFLGSNLNAPSYLYIFAAQKNQIVFAVILELILAISVAGIGFVLSPVLKKSNESVALGYVVFRLMEALLIVFASICLLLILSISQDYTSGSLNAASAAAAGTVALALREWSYMIGTLIFLGLGGLALNFLLYISKLVPRWLSIWGFIGALLAVVYGGAALFDISRSELSSPWSLLAIPIALQEMVFAVWIIVKGFRQSDTATDPLNAAKISFKREQ
jgi:hypothetical protein